MRLHPGKHLGQGVCVWEGGPQDNWETGNEDTLLRKLLLIQLYSNQSVSPLPSYFLKQSNYCVS